MNTIMNTVLLSWGANSYGQLGLGHKDDILLPSECTAIDRDAACGLAKIAGGGGHTALLTKEGDVLSCGWNKNGQLGHNHESTDDVTKLVKTRFLPKIARIACGWNHTLAVSDSGQVFAWGSNSFGQLGMPGCSNRNSEPIHLSKEVFEGNSILDIGAGLRHSVAVAERGLVFTWGNGKKGQLGLGYQGLIGTSLPRRVTALSGVQCKQVSAGAYHTAISTSSGEVHMWGYNQHGQCAVMAATESNPPLNSDVQCARDDLIKMVLIPHILQGLPPVLEVQCGWSHTLAVTTCRRVFSWGRADYGQLGLGGAAALCPAVTPQPRFMSTPSEIVSLRGICQVVCGSEHCIAIDIDGKLLAWGWNEHGMCARRGETNVLFPHPVEALRDWRVLLLGAGAGHCMALAETDDTKTRNNGSPAHHMSY